MRDFISTYRKHILNNFLKDPDFSFFLSYNNLNWSNERTIPKDLCNIKGHIEFNQNRIKFIHDNKNKIGFSEDLFFSESEIQFLIKQEMWNLVSQNTNPEVWSIDFIEKYQTYLSWFALSRNNSIYWTKELIKKFEKKLHFTTLSHQPNIEIDFDIYNQLKSKWDIRFLCSNSAICQDVRLEEEILNHPDCIWIEKEKYFYNVPNPSSTFQHRGVCLNSGIEWTYEKYEKHSSKIDLWLLAKYGNLQYDIITRHAEELDEKRKWDHKGFRTDWKHFPLKIYKTGWENLLSNMMAPINHSLLELISQKQVIITKVYGEERIGYYEKEEETLLIDLLSDIDYKNVQINYNQFIRLDFLSIIEKLVSKKDCFPDWIYKNILKPEFTKDKDSIKRVFKTIMYAHNL